MIWINTKTYLVPDQESSNKDNIWIDSDYGTRLYFNNEYKFEISKESMYMYRSFNRGKFMYGGRFYTPVFQGIPSAWRNTITIDGEETVELDYSAHHIRLLYHELNLDFKGEPYIYKKSDKANVDKRQIHKYVAMIAINANSEKQTINAVRETVENDIANGKFNSEIPTKKEIKQYYNDFVNHHKPIAKYISNDAGIKLQRKDSDIMSNILIELAINDIAALPVHDSVIVQKKYKEKLKNIMSKEYYKFMTKYPVIS